MTDKETSFRKAAVVAIACAVVAALIEISPKVFIENNKGNVQTIVINGEEKTQSVLESKDMAFQASLMDSLVSIGETISEPRIVELGDGTIKSLLKVKIGEFTVNSETIVKDYVLVSYNVQVFGFVSKSMDEEMMVFSSRNLQVPEFNENVGTLELLEMLTKSNIKLIGVKYDIDTLVMETKLSFNTQLTDGFLEEDNRQLLNGTMATDSNENVLLVEGIGYGIGGD